MALDLWINLYQSKKHIPQKSVFSTACFKCEKKLPYGKNFFLHTKIFGLNTFWIALHMIYMDNFN